MSRHLTLALSLLCFLTLASSIHVDPRDLDAPLLDCYDYIIVGGGVSGLVVANRLTENPNVTVLVLEAGPLDANEDFIMFPIEDGYGLGTKYDWNLWTAPQTFLDGAARPYDMGRGVGGGSLINGMCWTRGGSADYDAWKALGNDGWGWNDLLPYFQKASRHISSHLSILTYFRPKTTLITSMLRSVVNCTFNQTPQLTAQRATYMWATHDTSTINLLFLDGLQELGIPTLTDPNNGTAAGGMLIPNSINPDNQTRSYARLDYFDGFINRPNLHVTTHQHVTRVLINAPHNLKSRDYPAGFWISGVEVSGQSYLFEDHAEYFQFVTDGSLTLHNVSCSREVILAAGAVHTPQILELSGIGSAEILNQFDIPVIINLPGVGNNFQDHPYLSVVYYYDNTSYININTIENSPVLSSQAEQEYYANKTGPWTAGAINTVAFPSLPSISQNWTNMMDDAYSQNSTQYLISGLDRTIIAGYEAQTLILTALLSRTDVGAYEILNDNVGLLAVAAMHPFSRGSVHIQSTNPYLQPLIDPRYCSNPLDCQVLVEALLFNNQLVNTTSMSVLCPTPYYPFLQGATKESLIPAINSGIRTEFHGTGSTSMLPLNLGGVVDTHLRVYGTKNLRIVDAGIQPLVPAAHLQAPVYAVAEKAADIIKADNLGLTPKGCGANSGFAGQGPVIANHSLSSSTSISSSTPSTFPEFLDPSVLSSIATASHFVSSTRALSLASGASLDQLPPTASVNPDAIMSAASIFLAAYSTLTLPSFSSHGNLLPGSSSAFPQLSSPTIPASLSVVFGNAELSSGLASFSSSAVINVATFLGHDHSLMTPHSPSPPSISSTPRAPSITPSKIQSSTSSSHEPDLSPPPLAPTSRIPGAFQLGLPNVVMPGFVTVKLIARDENEVTETVRLG
ncbi:related to alcohol oxidase [Phialocephala subalpina]|uniref:Related to alcohol oxidase n=1 Tax=Phialocephala subalpina TaxID=576137 RepID=A0A1L7XDV7_9HELO|nr:related to alcohol oxidase [Phialocephala subalpina]